MKIFAKTSYKRTKENIDSSLKKYLDPQILRGLDGSVIMEDDWERYYAAAIRFLRSSEAPVEVQSKVLDKVLHLFTHWNLEHYPDLGKEHINDYFHKKSYILKEGNKYVYVYETWDEYVNVITLLEMREE